jgi:nucleoside-diphosphate-sugar epimerase
MKSEQQPFIGLIGCGWLGRPLAQQLIVSGHRVLGTTTRATGLSSLLAMDVEAIQWSLARQAYQDWLAASSVAMLDACRQCDWVVINIPPKRRDLKITYFMANLKALCSHVLNDNPHIRLIFVSTTSVFGEIEGDVDETTPVAPATPSAELHVNIENFLLQTYPTQTVVLRLGGLIGLDRHPVTSICRRESFIQGEQRVNLIHQADAIGILQAIFSSAPCGQILHGVAPAHPSRLAFYQRSAKRRGLIFPTVISSENQTLGKIVHAQKTQQMLGYTYQFPNIDH